MKNKDKRKSTKIICPVCGKPCLQIRRYIDGSGFAVHEEKIVLGFMEMKGCQLGENDVPSN